MLLKMFVDDHLASLLRNDFRVNSIQEYGEYLSLPHPMEGLKRHQNRINNAIRVRKLWKKKMEQKKAKAGGGSSTNPPK